MLHFRANDGTGLNVALSRPPTFDTPPDDFCESFAHSTVGCFSETRIIDQLVPNLANQRSG